MKKYYLILYQGLRREVFYWEFLNTTRKVLIICLNTILSVISLNYKILLGIILLVIIIRIQLAVSPYIIKVNDDLEVMSIISGMLVLYCGLIFEEGQNSDLPIFDSLAMIVLIIFNVMFLLLLDLLSGCCWTSSSSDSSVELLTTSWIALPICSGRIYSRMFKILNTFGFSQNTF